MITFKIKKKAKQNLDMKWNAVNQEITAHFTGIKTNGQSLTMISSNLQLWL